MNRLLLTLPLMLMPGLVLANSNSTTALAAQVDQTTSPEQQLQQFQPYAQFFGFDDTVHYLQAAGTLQQLLANSTNSPVQLTADELKLQQKNPADWTDADRRQLQQQWQQKRTQLAHALDVPVPRLNGLLTEFARFNALEIQLEQQKNPQATALPAPAPAVQFSVSAAQWQQWQELPVALQAIAIAWWAQQQGVSAWQEFRVQQSGQVLTYRLSPQLGAVPAPV